MVLLKRFSLAIIGLVMMLLVAACGGSTTTGSGSTPTAAPTTAPAAVIKTASATVGGKSVTILTDAKGMTLYYYTPDTTTTQSCTGQCLVNWPAVTFTGTGQPTASSQLPGTLGTLQVSGGNQVTYNGHLLYTFIGDKAPGDVNGQGKGGVWFAATTDLSTPILKTAQATVGGKSVTILTDEKGMTLYYFTPDTATTTACTGGCAQAWPPLLFTGTGQPTPEGLSKGTLAVVQDANGNQVTFNGHMLYTFAKDTAPGQTTGQGVGGKWFVATTDLAVMK